MLSAVQFADYLIDSRDHFVCVANNFRMKSLEIVGKLTSPNLASEIVISKPGDKQR